MAANSQAARLGKLGANANVAQWDVGKTVFVNNAQVLAFSFMWPLFVPFCVLFAGL